MTSSPLIRVTTLAALLVAALCLMGCRSHAADAAGPVPRWPWPRVKPTEVQPGVTHWLDKSDPGGTTLDLFAFDFAANPRLRLELYDQDEDDETPGNGKVPTYGARGAAQVLDHLQKRDPGRVLAVWNALFFDYSTSAGAVHVSPVVLRGKAHCFGPNYRWTFGVHYDAAGAPEFRLEHQPDRAALEERFAFGAGAAQALIREGRPLRLQPPPRPDDPPLRRPVPSTPEEAGHIPGIDFLNTSRTSVGWSRDSGRLYVLIVKEPVSGASVGGWTLEKLQQFWKALGTWGAANLDGGPATQIAYRRRDDRIELLPSIWTSRDNRVLLPAGGSTPLTGGVLTYFCVREAPAP